MEKINLKQLLFLSFLGIIGIFGLSAYIASLVIPDWIFFVENPFWHSFVAWMAFGFIAFLTIVILYFIVDLAIDKEVLVRKSEAQEKVITGLEKDLVELKRRG